MSNSLIQGARYTYIAFQRRKFFDTKLFQTSNFKVQTAISRSMEVSWESEEGFELRDLKTCGDSCDVWWPDKSKFEYIRIQSNKFLWMLIGNSNSLQTIQCRLGGEQFGFVDSVESTRLMVDRMTSFEHFLASSKSPNVRIAKCWNRKMFEIRIAECSNYWKRLNGDVVIEHNGS